MKTSPVTQFVAVLLFGIVVGFITYRALARATTSTAGDISSVLGAVGGAGVMTFLAAAGKDGTGPINTITPYCIGLFVASLATSLWCGSPGTPFRLPKVKKTFAALAVALIASTCCARAQTDPASALFQRGDFTAAATAYAAVLSANPTDASAELNLGAIRVYQNDLTGAEPLLRAALAANPASTRAARLLREIERRRSEAARRVNVIGGEADVPFVTSDPLPVVRVVANGKPANFVVDTGGSVDLEPDFAASAGVKTVAAGNGVFAGGKQAAMQSGTLTSLSLGGATSYDVPVHVLPMHSSSLFPATRIDGIVGTTFFERFLVTIDYPHNRLVLRPRSPKESAAFQAASAAAGATIVPCFLVGDHFMMAEAQVNDAPRGMFLFDSGLAGGGLMPSAALVEAAHITLDESHAGTGIGGGGAVTAVPFVADRVAVGSAVQFKVRGLYTPEGSPLGMFPFTVWGMVSNDFLQHYAYTVDFDAMTIVLLPSR